MKQLMQYKRYDLTSPEVIAIFDGLWRSSPTRYYRIIDNVQVPFAPKKALMGLPMCGTMATRLLAEATFPTAPYIRREKKRKAPAVMPDCISIIKATVERYAEGDTVEDVEELGTTVFIPEEPPAKPPKRGPRLKFMEDDEPEEEAPQREGRMKPYQIVQTNSGYWGVFSNDTATTRICGRERQDAEQELLLLVKRREPFSWSTVKYSGVENN